MWGSWDKKNILWKKGLRIYFRNFYSAKVRIFFSCMFLWVFYGRPMVCLLFSYGFLCFSYGLLCFSMVFLWFPMVFPWFPYDCPSSGFPMVSLWFWHSCPLVLLGSPYGFLMGFLKFPYGFPTPSYWIPYGFPYGFRMVLYGFPYGCLIVFPMVFL